MYDLLDIFFSVVVYLSPHDVKAIQVWPYAGGLKEGNERIEPDLA